MIAAEVREDVFRDRNVFEQHGAQEIVALKHMMAQVENQKHAEINCEKSEQIQVRNSVFRGEIRDLNDEIRSEEATNTVSASEQYSNMMRETEAARNRSRTPLDDTRPCITTA